MKVIDALGLRCPLPIIEAAKYLRHKEIGSKFQLLSDDPASEPDLMAWARMTGNLVIKLNLTTFEITKLTN